MRRMRIVTAAVAFGLVGSAISGLAAIAPSAGAATASTAVVTHSMVKIAPAAPAAPAGCPSGDLCGWTKDNYTGSIGKLVGNNTTLPSIPWHSVESIFNNGTACAGGVTGNVWVYQGTNYNSNGGHVAELHPGTGFNDMQAQLPALVDHVYSNHWCTAS